jgi:hypothetical protein
MEMVAQSLLFTDAQPTILEKVNVARQSPDLTKTESFVLDRLIRGSAFGLDNVVSIQTMQRMAKAQGLKPPSDRSIKDAVKTLLEVYDIPIGSCRIPGKNGYYFCVSDEDCEDAVRPLKAEIYSMFRRIKVLSPKSAFVKRLQGQMALLSEE